ncbi:cAMP-binding domain of CRP or a regulatory subunit of cAMP-dependent protein kinases [Yoonia rosea]|uniref:cAMP-binding domain of CRP or a regulatory subunit of cAMP-dependent protein kinases n=1 Tax=Yoonia rosea TaxID=287098 RepID=A0A1R3XG68_9RHOB|nr:Crp/Fnr family transcriptional regulator [Yoonia rosea]SIT90289.1 cAMP-binding domain of CRP or a regulatory subunit of cAMP-dependent protein kinases [Yoonia rosea]
MATKCKQCPLRLQHQFLPMSQDEVNAMQRFKVGELVVDAGAPILMQGSNSPQLFTALHGMGLRYKYLENGKRQVVNFILPGDFIGLQAGVMGEMGHSVEATTKMTLCVFDRSAIWNFFKDNPERAFSVTWLAAIEEHFLGDALATVGQRDALQSVAWALAKVYLRGQQLNMVSKSQMPLPFRQQDLADALGLSLVHTNKTLAKLRDRQLAQWSDGVLSIADIDKLAAIAMIEDTTVPPRPLL